VLDLLEGLGPWHVHESHNLMTGMAAMIAAMAEMMAKNTMSE
jgi:hypothetical protein